MADFEGRVLWFELLTNDVKSAERFYTAVVGWSVAPFEGSPDPYDVWMRASDAGVGGVMKIPQGMNFPPHWGMYVGVHKLDDGVSRVERLGGSSLSPVIEVPTVGRMRTMKDPQGATFSVFQPDASSRGPEPGEPQVGDLSWIELITTNPDAALTFYTELFPWRAMDAMDMGEMGKYQMFGLTAPMGGMMKKPPTMAIVPPHWMMYFRVSDARAAADRVKANGGQVLHGPEEVAGGDRILNCQDPQGAVFSLHQKK